VRVEGVARVAVARQAGAMVERTTDVGQPLRRIMASDIGPYDPAVERPDALAQTSATSP